MRLFLVKVLVTLVILATLASPVFAQAPVPTVTISGLFDQITSMGRNFYDGNLTRDSDHEWYARTRFRPDLEWRVGRVAAVLGLEIDLAYGQMGPNDGGFPGNNSGSAGGAAAGPGGSTPGGCKVNASACLALNNDVAGIIKIKWIYTEFPLTGKDSLLPFITLDTLARAGGQPFDTLANYKLAAYASGDFAGASAITTITPQIKNNLAYVILEDDLAGSNRGNPSLRIDRGKDYALIFSPEISPFKGLDLKPLYSWFHADGETAGAARRNLTNRAAPAGRSMPRRRGADPSAPRPLVIPHSTKIAIRSASMHAGVWGTSVWIPPFTTSLARSTARRSTTALGRTGPPRKK